MTKPPSHRQGTAGRERAGREAVTRAALRLLAALAFLVPAAPSRAAAVTTATPLELAMSVRVVDATGWPIERARVGLDGRRASSALTGADGRCVLRLPLGTLRDLSAHPIDLTVRAESRDQRLALTEGGETLRLQIAVVRGAPGGGTVRVRSNSAVAAAVMAAALRGLESQSIGLDVSFIATTAAPPPVRSDELAAILDVEVPGLATPATTAAQAATSRPPMTTPQAAPASPATTAQATPTMTPSINPQAKPPTTAQATPTNPATAAAQAPPIKPSMTASQAAPAPPPASTGASEAGAVVPPSVNVPVLPVRLRAPAYASARLQPRPTPRARASFTVSKPVARPGRPVALAADMRKFSAPAGAYPPSTTSPTRTSPTPSGSPVASVIPRASDARTSSNTVFGTSGQTTRTMERVISTPSNEVPVLTPSDAAVARDAERPCGCRVTGTVELDWDRPLPHPMQVMVSLLDDASVCDTLWLYMGSPRAFALRDVPCGAHRLHVRLPSGMPYDLATPESRMIFDCQRAPLRPMRVVLIRR